MQAKIDAVLVSRQSQINKAIHDTKTAISKLRANTSQMQREILNSKQASKFKNLALLKLNRDYLNNFNNLEAEKDSKIKAIKEKTRTLRNNIFDTGLIELNKSATKGTL